MLREFCYAERFSIARISDLARRPKPWFRKFGKTWLVTINGEPVNLGKDKEQAMKDFHELMARTQKQLSEHSAGCYSRHIS
jgi:hypothetical protein